MFRKLLLVAILGLLAGPLLAQRHGHSSDSSAGSSGSVYVHGYTRKDGTQVSAHYRRAPGTTDATEIGGDRSDLSSWAAEHRSSAGSTSVPAKGEPRAISTSAGSGNYIAWSRPGGSHSSPSSGAASSATVAKASNTPRGSGPSHATSTAGVRYGRSTSTAPPTYSSSHATSTHRSTSYCSTCTRDSLGRIRRSEEAKLEFERETGFPHGRRGYVIDHIRPLACGGADAPSNMQWQTSAEAKAKDSIERKGCS